MKNSRIVSVIGIVGVVGIAALAGGFAAAPAAAPAPAHAASDFKVDGGHSSVVYKINHLGVSNFYGRFNAIDGEFTFDAAAPESAKINVTIKADSIDSGNGQRDGHLKSPDFFNVKQFPEITFKSTGVKKAGDGFELTGDLTLLGQTKPITATLVHVGEKDAGARFGYRSGLEARFKINRGDFGMKYMIDNGGLGAEVEVVVALEGARK